MESLGTGRKGAQRGAKGRKGAQRGRKRQEGAERGRKRRKEAERGRKRQKEAFPLPVPVPSDSIAGPPKNGKKSLAGGKLGSFYRFTFLPFYL